MRGFNACQTSGKHNANQTQAKPVIEEIALLIYFWSAPHPLTPLLYAHVRYCSGWGNSADHASITIGNTRL